MAKVVCEKCSKEVRSDKRGTLTQWIFDESSCACNRPNLVKDSAITDKICPECFNFKLSRRTGSMTQWIFLRQQCKCSSLSNVMFEPASENSSVARSSSLEPAPEEDFAVADLPFSTERYKPLRYIARNSASVVYKCFDRHLNRLVAIKTLSFPDSAVLIDFQKEARTTGRLNHPNIVEVLATKRVAQTVTALPVSPAWCHEADPVWLNRVGDDFSYLSPSRYHHQRYRWRLLESNLLVNA
jgi:hypothetical protein